MATFLPVTESASRTLAPKETLEIQFPVANAGPIQLLASAGFDGIFPLDPTARRVDLFEPGVAQPVAFRTDPGLAIATPLSHQVPQADAGLPGEWTARVTNLENTPQEFTLRVTYPGTTPLQTITVPAALVDAFVNSVVSQIRVHLTRGANQSFVDFPPNLNVQDVHFTIPDFVRTIDLLLFQINIVEFVDDVNTNGLTFSLENAAVGFANGFMRLVATFEEAGREIRGTFAAQLSDMKLTVDLGLTALAGRVSYGNVRTRFDTDVDLVGLPDFILDPIFQYSDQIRNLVENETRKAFDSAAIRQAITAAIASTIAPLLPANARIASVRVVNGALTLEFFEGRRLPIPPILERQAVPVVGASSRA